MSLAIKASYPQISKKKKQLNFSRLNFIKSNSARNIYIRTEICCRYDICLKRCDHNYWPDKLVPVAVVDEFPLASRWLLPFRFLSVRSGPAQWAGCSFLLPASLWSRTWVSCGWPGACPVGGRQGQRGSSTFVRTGHKSPYRHLKEHAKVKYFVFQIKVYVHYPGDICRTKI